MPNYLMKIKTEFYAVVTANDEEHARDFTEYQYRHIGGEPSVQVWGEVSNEKLDTEIEWNDAEYFNLEKE